jgi:hypothetical protein
MPRGTRLPRAKGLTGVPDPHRDRADREAGVDMTRVEAEVAAVGTGDWAVDDADCSPTPTRVAVWVVFLEHRGEDCRGLDIGWSEALGTLHEELDSFSIRHWVENRRA